MTASTPPPGTAADLIALAQRHVLPVYRPRELVLERLRQPNQDASNPYQTDEFLFPIQTTTILAGKAFRLIIAAIGCSCAVS